MARNQDEAPAKYVEIGLKPVGLWRRFKRRVCLVLCIDFVLFRYHRWRMIRNMVMLAVWTILPTVLVARGWLIWDGFGASAVVEVLIFIAFDWMKEVARLEGMNYAREQRVYADAWLAQMTEVARGRRWEMVSFDAGAPHLQPCFRHRAGDAEATATAAARFAAALPQELPRMQRRNLATMRIGYHCPGDALPVMMRRDAREVRCVHDLVAGSAPMLSFPEAVYEPCDAGLHAELIPGPVLIHLPSA